MTMFPPIISQQQKLKSQPWLSSALTRLQYLTTEVCGISCQLIRVRLSMNACVVDLHCEFRRLFSAFAFSKNSVTCRQQSETVMNVRDRGMCRKKIKNLQVSRFPFLSPLLFCPWEAGKGWQHAENSGLTQDLRDGGMEGRIAKAHFVKKCHDDI